MQLGPSTNTGSVLENTGSQQVKLIEEKYKQGDGYATRKYLQGKFLGKGGFAKCWEFIN